MKFSKLLIPTIAIFCFSFSIGQKPLSAYAGTVVARINGTFYSTLANAVSSSSAGDTIYVLEDLTLTSVTTISKNLHICSEAGNPVSLKRSFSGNLFTVTGNTTLTLSDITLDGNKSAFSGNTGSLVNLSGTASTSPVLNMEEGTNLINNKTVNGAAAVQVAYGTLNMLGGSIKDNQSDFGISAVYGGTGSGALNLLGGEISNNYTTNGALAAAMQASLFNTISVGGNMTIKENYKGSSVPTSNTGFADLDVGTKEIHVTDNFVGTVYVYSSDINRTNYRFNDTFGSLAEGASIGNGYLYNNQNAFLHGEVRNSNQIYWDYYYTAPSTVSEPTATNVGTIRQYAYVNSTSVASTTIYKDIVLPALNPTDYTVTYNPTSNTITYVWNDSTYGDFSFEVPFAQSDLATAKMIADDLLSDYVLLTSSDEIKAIVDNAKADADTAASVADVIDILDATRINIINQLVDEAQEDVRDLLFDYIGNQISPSQAILDIINAAISEVNNTNYQDVSGILSNAESLLDIQLLIEAKEAAAQQIEALLNSLTTTPSTALLLLESEALDALSSASTLLEVQSILASYSLQINEAYINEQISIAKEEIDQHLADLSGEPSSELMAIAAEAKDELDNATNVSEINALLDYYENLLNEQKLSEIATLFAETYNEYANENRYQYSSEGLDALDEIFNNGEDFYNDPANDIMDIIEYLENAIEDLIEVPIVRVGDFNPEDENFDETLYDSSIFNGVISPNVPVPSDSRLVVDILEIDNASSIYDSILENKIVPEFNEKTVEEIRESFINQIIFSEIRISLVNSDDEPISFAEGSEFEITLLLPESYKDRVDINVIGFTDDSVEVFGVSRRNNLITFTVNRLGSFYLIGDMTQNETSPLAVDVLNLWWIIILLAVILIGEGCWIVYKHLPKKSQENRANSSVMALIPIMVILIPNNAILIIILLAIGVLIATLYIAYLFLIKRRQKQSDNALTPEEDKTEAERADDKLKGNQQ